MRNTCTVVSLRGSDYVVFSGNVCCVATVGEDSVLALEC